MSKIRLILYGFLLIGLILSIGGFSIFYWFIYNILGQ